MAFGHSEKLKTSDWEQKSLSQKLNIEMLLNYWGNIGRGFCFQVGWTEVCKELERYFHNMDRTTLFKKDLLSWLFLRNIHHVLKEAPDTKIQIN